MNESLIRRITSDATRADSLDDEGFRALLADIRQLPEYDIPPVLRSELSTALLAISICPIHFRPYRACFDNDDHWCAAVRIAFPAHMC